MSDLGIRIYSEGYCNDLLSRRIPEVLGIPYFAVKGRMEPLIADAYREKGFWLGSILDVENANTLKTEFSFNRDLSIAIGLDFIEEEDPRVMKAEDRMFKFYSPQSTLKILQKSYEAKNTDPGAMAWEKIEAGINALLDNLYKDLLLFLSADAANRAGVEKYLEDGDSVDLPVRLGKPSS